jgi:hypothetical protein
MLFVFLEYRIGIGNNDFCDSKNLTLYELAMHLLSGFLLEYFSRSISKNMYIFTNLFVFKSSH